MTSDAGTMVLGAIPFMPHGHCYYWSENLIGLHAVSDGLIFLAYYSIPMALVYFVRRRTDLEFHWMFVCFAVFILACGTTHLLEVWNIWHADYWLSGGTKALTAVASVPTAILLVRLLPRALALPSPRQLRAANDALQTEIVERRRIESILQEKNVELRNAAEARNRFVAGMSHELRTPLNGIIGFSELLCDGKAGPLNPRQQEYLHDVLGAGRHLLQLINDVLDLEKVEAGKLVLTPERFPVRQAIEDACAVSQPLADKKDLTVAIDVAPELGDVELDPQRFRQVLLNLLSNAIKFTNAGRVEVRAAPDGPDTFVVSVTDTGIGIREEDLPRLYREFEQLESGAARRFEGTGLGLALTRRFVELLGGTIAVRSRVGHGTTFVVALPCRQPGAAA